MRSKFGIAAIIFAASMVSAFASDLPTYKAPIAAPASTNWNGLYVTGFIGAGRSNNTATVDDPVTTTSKYGHSGCWSWKGCSKTTIGQTGINADAVGLVIGGGVGYDWRIANYWVVGLEADLMYSSISGTGNIGNVQATQDFKWLGFAGGRVGFLITPSMLAYFKGGAAIADISFVTNTVGGASNTRWGYGLGGGIEMQLPQVAQGLSIRGEAMYDGFGKSNIGPGLAVVNNDVITVTIGAVKKFNGGTGFLGL